VKFDLIIAAASAGVLVYSGRLLVPSARLRPEDIISYKPLPIGISYSVERNPSGEIVGFTQFREDEATQTVRDVLDAKMGFDLLVIGTIASVGAIIVGAFTPSQDAPSSLDIASAAVALVLGVVAGWWTTTRSRWRRTQERRLLVHCFLAWLEREVDDPKIKGYTFGLAVVSTVRHSGLSLTNESQGKEADEKSVERWVVALARRHRYPWRRGDFRKWASEV
jgi:hypothetical protein